MLDIHAHLIPKVDDGSKTLESSLAMVEEEVKQGIDKIIITPHYFHHKYECPVSKTREKFDELKTAVEEKGLKVDLRLGQEIMYTDRVDLLEMLDKGEILTLDNTKYVLLEFNPVTAPESINEVIYNFSLKNYKVIVAHVERYKWMTKELVDSIIAEGGYIQINADSVMGKYGFKAKLFTHQLLKKGKVNFIASDMHHFRINCMADAYKKWGKYLKEIDIK